MENENTPYVVLSFGMNIYQRSNIQPIALAALFIIFLIILFSKREYVFMSMIFIMLFIPSGQRIIIAGIDFTFLRIAVILIVVRIFLKNENLQFKLIKLDKLVIVWSIITIVTFTILHNSFSAFINRLGFIIDTSVGYFIIRCLVRGRSDVENIFKWLMVFSIPVIVFLLIEHNSGYNIFSIFGGVPAQAMVREGRLRVQGAFSHPILSGCFWASIFPFYLNNYIQKRHERAKMAFFLLIFIVMIYFSASSTPFIGLAVGVMSIFLYQFRRILYFFPVYAIASYIILDIAMKAPVWHLISRIDIAGGSTGWHRFWLIDQAIRNFDEWALYGVKSIFSWNVFANDITNQYIKVGVNGGIFTLFLFVWILIEAVRIVLHGTEVLSRKRDMYGSHLMWALGAALAVHIINYIGVSYFGQIVMLVYINIAMIGSMYQYEILDSKKISKIIEQSTNKIITHKI